MSFCVSGILRDGLYHRRSIDNVVKEIEYLYYTYQVKTIVFYDDTFFPSPISLDQDVSMFTTAMTHFGNKIQWQVEMRPNVLLAMDDLIANRLFKAGCRQINVGIEKSYPGASPLIGKGVDSGKEVRKACLRIHKGAPSMRLTGTFILGGPDETSDTINNTIEFAISLDLIFAHFYPLELYPGTELFKQLLGTQGHQLWYQKIMSDNLPWVKYYMKMKP